MLTRLSRSFIIGMMVASVLSAQVNDGYEHAVKGGHKRLSRCNFEHALENFIEARDVLARTDVERAEAQLGVAECHRRWTRYEHAAEKYVLDPEQVRKAEDAFRVVLRIDGATAEQRSKAQLGVGLCRLAADDVTLAQRPLTDVANSVAAAPEDRKQAASLLTALEQGRSVREATVVEPDLTAAYRGVYPEAPDRESGDAFFANDSLGGTLARDHQSRGMYFAGRYRRTYIAYLDHHFMARVTYYDHDAKAWAWRPEPVDHCQGSYSFKDGHNAPNIFVSRDGTIHLFYGSHGSALKYARSVDPECIKRFEIGRRIGRRATYPYVCQRTTGELLMFYRRSGPRGGYYHGHTALRRSLDNGGTWAGIDILLQVEGGAKLCNNAVVYCPKRDCVYVMPTVKGESGWNSYLFVYALGVSRISTINGTDLGAQTTEKELARAGGKVLGGQLENTCLHDGVLYLIGTDASGRRYLATWDGTSLTHRLIQAGALADVQRSPVVLPDGALRVYGLRANGHAGAGLSYWETRDEGATWADGGFVLTPGQAGHALQALNLVMNYAGDGPILLASEPTGPMPEGWVKTRETHYDHPGRRDRRLYAVDAAGRVLHRVSPFKPY